jgi:hypothetical protein
LRTKKNWLVLFKKIKIFKTPPPPPPPVPPSQET